MTTEFKIEYLIAIRLLSCQAKKVEKTKNLNKFYAVAKNTFYNL